MAFKGIAQHSGLDYCGRDCDGHESCTDDITPAARQCCNHLVHEPGEVVDSATADGIFAHHHAGAESVHHTIEVPTDQATGRIEGPSPHICRRTDSL